MHGLGREWMLCEKEMMRREGRWEDDDNPLWNVLLYAMLGFWFLVLATFVWNALASIWEWLQ